MFMGADLVVKGVLIGLVFASIVTWTVALAKLAEIWLARRRARRALHTLLSATDTMQAASALERQRGVIPELIGAATEEVRRSGAQSGADGIKERIAMRFQRMEAGEARRILAGTGVLATIGATAPFVGLFGTVWGIMNSFIGISKSQTTNLAVVAPGIAEALLATAIGLVAAIPAVVAYNIISRASAGYRSLVADAAAEILRTVSRDLDRHKVASSEASARGATAMAAE
jgi:biopolymer transport protein ExbB